MVLNVPAVADGRAVTRSSKSETECDSGNCTKNFATQETAANRANNKELRAITEKVKKQIQAKEALLAQQIEDYSSSPEVKAAVSHGLRNKSYKSKGRCYRAVKFALAASPPGTKKKGLIPQHFSDPAAVNAKDSLKSYGFINLLEISPYDKLLKGNPAAAPKGAILVYSSGLRCRNTTIKDCGHIEIKTDKPGKPGYISDYYSTDPISETERNRNLKKPIYKLVSIMIKPLDIK